MGKNKDIRELTNIMSKSLRHKIGSIVNKDEFYAAKYAKDAEVLMKEAEKVLLRQNWNKEDQKKIKELLEKKLYKELEEKSFIDKKKFDIMYSEIESALRRFELF